MSEILQISREGRLLHLALNRPEKRNALNLDLCRDLVAALERADSDPSIGAVLLKGNGKAFCAGMDLTEVLSPVAGSIHQIHEQLFTVGSRMSKPVVAVVHGAALAGGTGLVANCHVVVACVEASFGLTEIRLGLWPFVIFRALILAIGERRATELSLTGRIFGAQEAREFGLVHQAVPAAELESRSREIAGGLATASPTALRSGLQFVQEIRGRSWEEAGEIVRKARQQVFESPDFAEGIRAFHEKRPPRWPSLEGNWPTASRG